MKKLLKDKGLIAAILIGVVLIGIVAYVIISSSQTIKVYVPSKSLSAGDVVTDDSLYAIEISANTPGNFLVNKEMVLGYKLKNNVEKDQLLYQSDFLASWESYNQDMDIPEDYVVTSLQIPNERACGGLIVAGDSVDVMLVSEDPVQSLEESSTKIEHTRNSGDVDYSYFVLSNVKVINTNSSLAEAQENDLTAIVDGKSNSGSYYIIALSYEDYKKIRQVENVGELWLNICPRQNEENAPLIEQMIGMSFTGLHDAQQPVQEKDGSIVKRSEPAKPEAPAN